MKINFVNETNLDIKEYKNSIRKAIAKKDPNNTMSIIFIDNEEIRRINNEFRHIDKKTDVLSFPDGEDNYLGDVFISLEQAFEQANNYNHSNIREVTFLAVHGYLHLKGYDHLTKEDEEIMFSLQNKILEEANIKR